MATHDFDALKGTTIAFDPAADTLHFASQYGANAAWLRFEANGADLKVWMGDDFIVLADTTYGELGTGDLTFANGSMFLAGGSGVDTLRGAGGKDFLDGRGGDDLLVGRNGDDTYVVDSVGDVVYEVADEGIDTVRAIVSLTLGANVENLWIRGAGALNGTGNALDNRIQAGAGDNVINGVGGIDTASYEDAAAGVSVWLGLATAQATGGSGSDTLLNIENLYGSGHDDLLRGNGFDNTLEGAVGDDTLVGGGGSDRLYSDIAHWDGRDELATAHNLLNGNDGNDTLQGSVGLDTLYGDAGSDVLRGDAGDDALHGGDSWDILECGEGNNFGNGDAGNDTVTGGSGHDTLYGGDGNDQVDALNGNNFANGGAGNDTVWGGIGRDTLHGGGGADRIAGWFGNDWVQQVGAIGATLTGGGGNDTLIGGDGADLIYGEEGYRYIGESPDVDLYYGGLGNDTLIATLGSDRLDGGGGIDTASFDAMSNPEGIRVNLAVAAAQDTGDGMDTLIGIENVIGSIRNDVIRGSSAANRLDGNEGNDWLLGGLGADVLVGGLGTDLFVFTSVAESNGTTLDVVLDFNHAQLDRIDLSRIDADVVAAGDQAFTFIGGAAFSGNATGQLRYNAANGMVYGSNDADAQAEFVLSLAGLPALVGADFIL